MSTNPLEAFGRLDPSILDQLQGMSDFAFESGALPRKVKLMMAMALDSSLGTTDGVRALAEQAMEAGATKEEIAETLKVAFYVCGASTVYTSGRALHGLF